MDAAWCRPPGWPNTWTTRPRLFDVTRICDPRRLAPIRSKAAEATTRRRTFRERGLPRSAGRTLSDNTSGLNFTMPTGWRRPLPPRWAGPASRATARHRLHHHDADVGHAPLVDNSRSCGFENAAVLDGGFRQMDRRATAARPGRASASLPAAAQPDRASRRLGGQGRGVGRHRRRLRHRHQRPLDRAFTPAKARPTTAARATSPAAATCPTPPCSRRTASVSG